MIHAFIYSYKNKNLKRVVDSLIENTVSEIFISIKDQHNLKRNNLFEDEKYLDKVKYEHIYWDSLVSPISYKVSELSKSSFRYFLIISDDAVVSKGWDKDLINFLQDKKAVVSGAGQLDLIQENLFYLKKNRIFSLDFLESNFVDRNFIFGKTDFLRQIFPIDIKYHGEEESASLALFKTGVKVFSAPSDFYIDLSARTLENKYTIFSLDHNYNLVVDELKKAPKEFLGFYGVNAETIKRLPYETNDVSYSHTSLSFHNVDSRKFIDPVNGIF
jgi:hypothetical protein